MDIISDGLRTLCAWLCGTIYMLIASLYDLFINISRVELLTSEQIHPIYQRITMILTIVMVFYVTFETVKFVIQPEQFSDKEKGASKIVLRMVLVVILIAFVPRIFSGAYWVQNKIFDTQVFSKVILGKQNVDTDQFGKNLSYNIFSMFYSLDKESFSETELEKAMCGKISCQQIVLMNYNELQTEGRLTLLNEGLNTTGNSNDTNTGETVKKYYINFNSLFAVGVGGFIAYMLLLYCVDAGVRVVQLLFLQIIAPIPIMGYLSPKKDGMFEKWTKQCFTTYLDLFLRVGIIYFVLLICQILGNAFANNTLINNVNSNMAWMIYIALIMGLLVFAKKAPKMLGELFPKMGAASGNFGLSTKDRGFVGAGRVFGAVSGATVGAVVGAASGVAQGWRRSKALRQIKDKNGNVIATKEKGLASGIWGAAKGAVSGTVGGLGRGLASGAKKGNILKNVSSGAQKQIQASQRFGNREESGYGLIDQVGDRAKGIVGARSRIQMQESEKASLSRESEALKRVANTESSIKKRALEKIKEGGAKSIAAKIAARELASAEAELKLLEDPSASRSRFRVGKYTDSDKAQTDYNNAILLAKSSINKSNFIDSNGNFDQKAYDDACQAAVSQVKTDDYTTAYKDDASAKAAYQTAVNKAIASVDKKQFIDPTTGVFNQKAYDDACQDAANKVNGELFIVGYENEDEAQKALGIAIDEARTNLDEKQKLAVASYVEQTGGDADAAIQTMVDELKTYVNEYNETAENNKRVFVNYDEITTNFKGFSDNVKKGEIRRKIDANAQSTIKYDAEIDRIKRQTSGSGINEGKK